MDSPSAATATSSPMNDIMTPRTKVARMLAEIDDEIDNAPTPSPTAAAARKPSDAVVEASLPSPCPMAVNERRITEENNSMLEPSPAKASSGSGSDADSSDGSVRRPQGRAARRMLLDRQASPSQSKQSPFQDVPRASRPSPSHVADGEDLYSATPLKQSNRDLRSESSPLMEDGNTLFVSPARSSDRGSEDELPSNPFKGKSKLAELVAQKRAERLTREAEEEERRKNRSSPQTSSDLPEEAFEGSHDPVDPAIERIMSDATRPSRKASKKALLEMERETQRLARQQALAHEMKVKKKFTTKDLFAKFNFRQSVDTNDSSREHPAAGDTTASSAPNSDGIEDPAKEPVSTPPSSPPTPLDRQKILVDYGALSKLVPVREDSITRLAQVDLDDHLPDIAEILRSSQSGGMNKTGRAEVSPGAKKGSDVAGKKLTTHYDSSDDDLEIIPQLPSHLRVFDTAAGSKGVRRSADSRAIQRLKHLSNMHTDDSRHTKKGSRPSVNPQMLDNQLRRQAKEQARKQQAERIEELRAKGIEVQTTEEREREAEAYENLLEKARQDAVKLREAEKAARKEARGEGAVQASSDEDEDEDYEGSGSEEDEDNDDEDLDEERAGNNDNLIDDAAEDASADEADIEESDEELEEEGDGDAASSPKAKELGLNTSGNLDRKLVTPIVTSRHTRISRVIVEDDDDEEDVAAPVRDGMPLASQGEDPFAAFNFGAAGNAGLLFSPTQAFNATMQTPTQLTQEDSFDILRQIAPPSPPLLHPEFNDLESWTDEPAPSLEDDSQVPESQRVDLHLETQPPATPVPAQLHRGASGLSETPGWEPSQDPGLPSPWSVQLKGNSQIDGTGEHETQSTVRLRVSESPAPSQNTSRRGRLMRRAAVAPDDSDDDGGDANSAALVRAAEKDAFREMARRRREALSAAERADADSEARRMMDEQAEESEDEYAGLGGDDYIAPETEQDKEMIDSSYIEVDERALAAHFAERQRIQDEAETSRMYKDLTTGALRRKMGANAFDLEEDEDEMAARRRQMRQQEEAKKRKALLKDVNVASLAEGKHSKGKDAFLRAIADNDDDEEVIRISDEEDGSAPATQNDSQSSHVQSGTLGPLLEVSGNKRHFTADIESDQNAPLAKHRRTEDSGLRRPASLLEVKESVSFLLDERHADTAFGPSVLDLQSDPENDSAGDAVSRDVDDDQEDVDGDEDVVAIEEARRNDGGFGPSPASMQRNAVTPLAQPGTLSQRRTSARTAVVDRLSLKRSTSALASAHGRTAWAEGPTTGGFKVPSLLRRATTHLAAGANERGVLTAGVSAEQPASGVKMGGTKKSSLAYQARAEERRAIVEAGAKRRDANTARIAQLRRHSSALNHGLAGRFE